MMTTAKCCVISGCACLATLSFISAQEKNNVARDVDAGEVRIAKEVFGQKMARLLGGEGYDIEDIELWSQHILESELDAATKPSQRKTAYAEEVRRTAELACVGDAAQPRPTKHAVLAGNSGSH